MCTVTYVPLGRQGFVLTSNRDESPSRAARGLVRRDSGLVFPQDEGAGGTWIATHQKGVVLCLLNGAFERHDRELPYRMSRGIVLLELMETPHIPSAFEGYDLSGIEPFTLVLAGAQGLWELRWDGLQRHLHQADPAVKYIWSSATLYDRTVRARREEWFRQWALAHPQAQRGDVLHFHKTAGEGNPWNDVVMNRNGIVQTISITQVVEDSGDLSMHYFDLLSNQSDHVEIGKRSALLETHSGKPAFLD